MAHFTGLTQLQNHPHRAGFDIGSKNVFSAKCGELLALFVGRVMELSVLKR